MKMILTIAGTDYDGTAAGRPAAGVFDVDFTWSVDDEWSLEFCVLKCGADFPFPPNSSVALTTTEDDGSSPVLRFTGDLQTPQVQVGDHGLQWAYSATDLKHRAQYVTLHGSDGSGTASYNLTPDDPLALYSLQGKTVGQILALVLTATANATALNAVGVGAYTSLTPPTLPSQTATDLGALSVVPPEPVQLQGMSILNTLEGLLQRYHPQYSLWVRPDGVIRVASIFSFPARTITLPTASGLGDDVDWPGYKVSTEGCFTAARYTGLDIQAAPLSLVQGTLSKGWTTTGIGALNEEATWTILDFLQPKDSTDDGTASSVTTSNCSVTSDYPLAHWVLNFWQGRQGWIRLIDTSASGIDIYEDRLITSCTALTAGGSATIGWDSSLPLARTSYTKYRIIGKNSSLALVSRKFHIREPTGNLLDLNTFVGSHLYPRFPRGTPFANNSQIRLVYYPTAVVQWSLTGTYPWFEVPVNVQLDPSTGTIVLGEPAVSKFADQSTLTKGYPADFAHGLPYDVKVLVPYNRGQIAARSPTSGYSGTAYTKYGLQRLMDIPLDSFTWAGDAPSLVALAAEHLAVVKDAVVEGGTTYRGLPTWDALSPGHALTFVTPGQTTPLDGLAIPLRSATIRWGEDMPDRPAIGLRFSNLKRPFQGDNLYTHPGLSGGSIGLQSDDILMVAEGGGMMGMSDYNDASAASGAMANAARGQNPLESATSDAPLARGGPSPLETSPGDNPLNLANQGPAPMSMTPGTGPSADDLGFSMDTSMPPPPPRPRAPAPAPAPPTAGNPINVDDPAPRRLTLREKRGEADDTTGGGG